MLAGATTPRVPGEADEGLRPLDPGQVRVPDGVRGLEAVARMDDALAVLAVPGKGPPFPRGAPVPKRTWPLRSIRRAHGLPARDLWFGSDPWKAGTRV